MYNTILINNLRTVIKKIKGITKQNKKNCKNRCRFNTYISDGIKPVIWNLLYP